MATGQTILDRMEVLNNELQLQAAESDVVRALIAINMAQDYFESIVAREPGMLGDQVATVVTVADTETTAFPAGVLRLDDLIMLSTLSKPWYSLEPLDEPPVGGSGSWPASLALGSSGRPVAFFTDGANIYWNPIPDAVYTLRWYGLKAATDITAAGTITYPDVVLTPFASFAATIMSMGVGDAAQDLSGLANATFRPVIDALSGFNRTGAPGLNYTRHHTT
jgi:hypothetical protein